MSVSPDDPGLRQRCPFYETRQVVDPSADPALPRKASELRRTIRPDAKADAETKTIRRSDLCAISALHLPVYAGSSGIRTATTCSTVSPVDLIVTPNRPRASSSTVLAGSNSVSTMTDDSPGYPTTTSGLFAGVPSRTSVDSAVTRAFCSTVDAERSTPQPATH